MNSRQRRENESLNETYRQNGWWALRYCKVDTVKSVWYNPHTRER
jgi:hypothetical protein